MIIGFHLIYNFNLSWPEHNFSRGYKLLHVFWNTLYKQVKTKLKNKKASSNTNKHWALGGMWKKSK